MLRDSIKTGQSIDILKERAIVPEVCALIQEQFPNGASDVCSMDIGAGDASSFLALQELLEERGIHFKDRAFVDCSTLVFPGIITNTNVENLGDERVYICQPDRDLSLGPSLSFYEDSVDFVIAQMVLHQIQNDVELSLLFCRTFLALKEDGCMYITDFSREYLQFLLEREQVKFTLTGEPSERRMEGTYHFDSGGSVRIVNRSLVYLVDMLLRNGLYITKVVSPSLEEVREIKERYGILEDEGIPMFNIIKVEKRAESMISYSSGDVGKIGITREGLMKITFTDRVSIMIPKIEGYKEIERGDKVILFEVTIPDGRNVCQVWVVPKDEKKRIWSTRLVSKE